jgi:hypothetical protein
MFVVGSPRQHDQAPTGNMLPSPLRIRKPSMQAPADDSNWPLCSEEDEWRAIEAAVEERCRTLVTGPRRAYVPRSSVAVIKRSRSTTNKPADIVPAWDAFNDVGGLTPADAAWV